MKKQSSILLLAFSPFVFANDFYSIVGSNDFTYVETDVTAPTKPEVLFISDLNDDNELTVDEINSMSNLITKVLLPNDAVVGDKLNITDQETLILKSSDISSGEVLFNYPVPDFGETTYLSASIKDISNNESDITNVSIGTQLYVDKNTLEGESYSLNYEAFTTEKFYQNFTMEAWVKPKETIRAGDISTNLGAAGTSGEQYVFYPIHGGNGTGVHGMGLSVGTNGVKVYVHSGGYMPPLFVSYRTISSTEWNHFTVSVNDGLPSIYLNGVHIGDGLKASSGNVFSPNTIGDNHAGYGPLKADVAVTRLWNGALNSTQIANNYNKFIQLNKSIDGVTLLGLKHNQ